MKLFAARRAILGTVAVAAILGTGSLFAMGAGAHVGGCRTDPIVKLSNGNEVHLSATIYDSETNVSKVTYTLYIPTGVSVTGKTFTGGGFNGKESIGVYANNPAHTYTSSYVVGETYSNINVTDSSSLVYSKTNKTLTTASGSGLTNQTLSLTVTG